MRAIWYGQDNAQIKEFTTDHFATTIRENVCVVEMFPTADAKYPNVVVNLPYGHHIAAEEATTTQTPAELPPPDPTPGETV